MPAGNTLSDSAANLTVDFIWRGVTTGWPTTWYFALLTTAPTNNTGSGAVEVPTSSTGYSRASLSRTTSTFTAGASRATASALAISWPLATASWGTIVGIAAYDALSGGTYFGYAALTTPTAVPSGQVPVISAGNFTFAV